MGNRAEYCAKCSAPHTLLQVVSGGSQRSPAHAMPIQASSSLTPVQRFSQHSGRSSVGRRALGRIGDTSRAHTRTEHPPAKVKGRPVPMLPFSPGLPVLGAIVPPSLRAAMQPNNINARLQSTSLYYGLQAFSPAPLARQPPTISRAHTHFRSPRLPGQPWYADSSASSASSG